jgi:BirA family transcriptional regulator, biotin operon repressor / biotin---[acetyl-CoA-carboxylase] ligase
MDKALLESLLTAGEGAWPPPILVESTASTIDDVAALAHSGAPEGTCVVAETQTAGRGRQGREWVSPPGAGLWLSVLVRPGSVPRERWAWLSLVAGLAARDAIRSVAGVPALLKWPNDLVVNAAACGGDAGPRKLGGILSQAMSDDVIVLGLGVNVALTSEELPVAQATSVFLEGGRTDREPLLAAILDALRVRVGQWRAADPVLAADYREACVTIGRYVEVTMPNGTHLKGIVSGVDDDGHLRVSDGEISTTVTAGDVVHATI